MPNLLAKNTVNTCHFQGTRETEADSQLIKVSEEIISEALIENSKEAVEVVSEEAGNMVCMVALENLDGLLSKCGS